MMRNALWVSLGVVLASGCASERQLVGGGDDGDSVLTLDDPAAASFVRAGSRAVSGRAEALTSVTVNDVPATLGDGTFDGTVDLERGVNLLEARGTDELGNTYFVRHGVLAGDYANASRPVENAVDVRINEDGLQTILDGASDMLVASELETTLQAANPVYSTSFDYEGIELADANASVTSLYFDHLSLYAEPMTDKLFVEVWVPNLYVGINLAGSALGWDYSTDAAIWANRIEVTGYVSLDAVSGKLVVDFTNPTLNLVGFGYDIDFIPDEIEAFTVMDGIIDFVEVLLADQMAELIPGLIEDALADLAIDFETEVMGKPLTIEGEFAHAGIDSNGVAIGLDLDINMPGSTAGAPGYLAAGPAAPHVDLNADMAIALSDNLLNRVLFEVWGGDLLAMNMSTRDGSLDPMMLAPLGASEGSIKIDGKLPPVIVEKNHGLQLQIAELEATIETPGADMGEYLRVALAVFADLQLDVRSGTLRLDIGSPELVMQVRESDWGASNEATTALLEDMLPIDSLLSLVGDIEIPLPELAGITIDSADVERDASGVHTGVEIDLR